MLQYPSVYIATVNAAHVLTEPPVLVVLNLDIVSNQLRPLTKLLELIGLKLHGFRLASPGFLARSTVCELLGWCFLFRLLSVDTFEIEDSHDLLSQIVFVNEFDNVLPNAGNLGDLENIGALVVVFV